MGGTLQDRRDDQSLAQLQAENDALRSTLVASDAIIPAAWRLTQYETTIFQALLKNDVVTKKTIVAMLYGAEAGGASTKNLDVFLSRLRQKTKARNVAIETIFGVGYRLIDREVWNKALLAGKPGN